MAAVDNPNLIKVIPKTDDEPHLPPSPLSDLQYTADGKLDGCVDDNLFASNPESAHSDASGSEHSESSDGECSESSRSSRSRSSSYYSSSGEDEKVDNRRRINGKRPPSPRPSSPRVTKKPSPPPRKPSPAGSDRKRKASPSPSKPTDFGNNLPRVGSTQLKERLLDHTVHIDMADLLPMNTARSRTDPNKGFSNSRREPIGSFALWARAYSVFMAYRTYNRPDMVIPMLKYLDLIGLYADPAKGYRLEQWLDYDHYFRRYATSHPDEPTIWAVRHEESYVRCMGPGTDRRSVAPPSQPANDYYDPPPAPVPAPPPPPPQPVIKPREVEVCLRFNSGNCTTPCIRKRRHVCLKCGFAGHGKYFCNKAGYGASRGRNY